jgi:FtsH-binding integral membrane protein
MIYALIVLGLVAFFDLKRVYRTCSKGQSVIITLLFAAIMVICLITASGVVLKSPIVIVGDLMKSIGLSYPPLK